MGMTCNFLDYDDPRMERVRAEVKAAITVGGVHPRLVVNYDQVWEMLATGATSKLWKDVGVGKKDDLGSSGCQSAKENHGKARRKWAASAVDGTELDEMVHKCDNWKVV